MICSNCNRMIGDDAHFCEFCGTKQNSANSSMRLDSSVTKLVPAKCCNCGANIEVNKEQDAAICTACGTPFIVEKAINLYITSQGTSVSDFEILSGVLKKYRGASVDVIIPEGVIEIESGAFDDCEYLNSVVFPSSLRKLPANAFKDNSKLTSVVFSQLECISESVFENCNMLKEVKLPDNLKNVEKNAFKGCRSLNSISLPASLESICEGAFDSCSSLASINLPNGLKAIEKNAFCRCTNLESIIIPNSIRRMKEAAFKDCKSLKTVKIPDGITILRDELFSGCTSLVEINGPSTLKEIGMSTFEKCTSLKCFKFTPILEKIGSDAFNGCISLEDIIFSSEIKSIPSGAFKGCSSLRHVELPKTLESIGSNAFDGCSALSDIRFPDSLQTIEDHAFAKCTSLKDVHLPKNINLEPYVFAMCPTARIFLPSTSDQITRLLIAAEKSKIVLRNITFNPPLFYFLEIKNNQKISLGGAEYSIQYSYDNIREMSAKMAKDAKSRNECIELCDLFHPYCKKYAMAYFRENYQFIYVGSSYQKNYKEFLGYEYGDVYLYDFIVMDDFLTDYVGYTQDRKGFDKESNYERFSSDIDNDREKLTKLFEYAGIKNYKIETVEAPIVKHVDGVFSSKYLSKGKRNFLRIHIPFTV